MTRRWLGLALYAEGPSDHRFLDELLRRAVEHLLADAGHAVELSAVQRLPRSCGRLVAVGEGDGGRAPRRTSISSVGRQASLSCFVSKRLERWVKELTQPCEISDTQLRATTRVRKFCGVSRRPIRA